MTIVAIVFAVTTIILGIKLAHTNPKATRRLIHDGEDAVLTLLCESNAGNISRNARRADEFAIGLRDIGLHSEAEKVESASERITLAVKTRMGKVNADLKLAESFQRECV